MLLGVRRYNSLKQTNKTPPPPKSQTKQNKTNAHPPTAPPYMASSSVGINLHCTFKFNEALKIYGSSEPVQ